MNKRSAFCYTSSIVGRAEFCSAIRWLRLITRIKSGIASVIIDSSIVNLCRVLGDRSGCIARTKFGVNQAMIKIHTRARRRYLIAATTVGSKASSNEIVMMAIKIETATMNIVKRIMKTHFAGSENHGSKVCIIMRVLDKPL